MKARLLSPKMKEFLLEIGVEEIPSRLISFGMKKMEESAIKFFNESRLNFEGIKTYGTPRRLILHVANLAENQAESSEEVIGPPKKISFDSQGNPTQACLKFAEAQGVAIKDLITKMTSKGEYLSVIKIRPRLKTSHLFKNDLPRFIQSISFPKSMVWGPSKVRFVRPIRWIVALYGEKPIFFKLGEIKSGTVSRGHRFMAPEPMRVRNFITFERQLRKQFVMIDPAERREIIQKEARRLGLACGGFAEIQEEILEQAANTVEYPVVFKGNFEESFLKLPKEIIINAMCEHQGYFPVWNAAGDQLLPHFIAVSNIKTRGMKIVQKGNERVLRSRLSDAQFYFESDLEVKLSDRVEELRKVVYQENLGTQFERVERLSALSAEIGIMLGSSQPQIDKARRAGFLSKADLLTGVVREFPKLQGLMGREYACLQGEHQEIAVALAEQYLPRTSGDSLPQTLTGKILSMADKTDAIVGAFGVGMIPTGSEDPYGLRRHGTGLVQIALSLTSPLSLQKLIEKSMDLFGKKVSVVIKKEVMEFLKQRFEYVLVSRGYRSDIIQSVISAEFNDLIIGLKKIEALTNFSLREKPVFEGLLALYKRMNNIVPKQLAQEAVIEDLFKTAAEISLHAALKEKTEEINRLKGSSDSSFEPALNALSPLKGEMDRFFIAVMVNDPDEQLKKNRLALLNRCLQLFREIADFSRITAEA